VLLLSVDVLLRQETAVSDVLLRHTSDVLLRSVGVLLRQETAVSDVLLRHTSDVCCDRWLRSRVLERAAGEEPAASRSYVNPPPCISLSRITLCCVYNC
jgi:hypothetical protein